MNSLLLIVLQSDGMKGSVSSNEGGKLKVAVDGQPHPPTFGKEITFSTREKYFPLFVVAKELGVTSLTLSKITGDVFFEPGKFANFHCKRLTISTGRLNLGLSMKFSGRNQQVLGYSRQIVKYPRPGTQNYFNNRGPQTVWEFSEKAVTLIQEYMQKFPAVFAVVNTNPTAANYKVQDLIPSMHTY